MSYQIYTDGGSRGNPGPAATGYIIKDPTGETVVSGGQYLGTTTNNIAEYQALYDAISHYLTLPLKTQHLTVFLDSNLVVQQMSGHFKIKSPHLKDLAIKIHSLIQKHHLQVNFQHIKRHLNQQADAQVNLILDQFA